MALDGGGKKESYDAQANDDFLSKRIEGLEKPISEVRRIQTDILAAQRSTNGRLDRQAEKISAQSERIEDLFQLMTRIAAKVGA